MVVERALQPQFLSNTYLVGEEGGAAFFVDAGGPVEPLIEAAERHAMTPTHVLLTHHHYDHVSELDTLLERWPDMEVLIHPGRARARRRARPARCRAATSFASATSRSRRCTRRATPPGCSRSSSSGEVFTGDTLFKNSVGGVRAPGSTSYEDLRDSIMGVLMELPPETVVRPGHTDPSTIGEEFENNAFVRVWRGLDPEGDEPCTAFGEPATLVLLGDDYDGGHKAWVRWPDGRDDIVPGSQVQRGG